MIQHHDEITHLNNEDEIFTFLHERKGYVRESTYDGDPTFGISHICRVILAIPLISCRMMMAIMRDGNIF